MSNKLIRVLIVIMVIMILMAIITFLWNKNKEQKQCIEDLRSNLSIMTENISRVKEAAKEREEKYREIQKNADDLNKQLEELKDAQSLEWLDSVIPEPVDVTIPY